MTISDPDEDVRAEAVVGLARCGDRRVLPALHRELASDSISNLEVEAASMIGEPDLHPQLLALQGWWKVDENLLEEAIQACSSFRLTQDE
jgi:HEAT repeat protein